MEKLVIDRSTWLRGEGSDESALLRSDDGMMCCLGFDALRRGFTVEEITDICTPMQLGKVVEGLTEEYPMGHRSFVGTEICSTLMRLNDFEVGDYETVRAWSARHESELDPAAVANEQEREQRIAKLFAEIGVEVEFVN